MKSFLFVFLFSVVSTSVFAQNMPDLGRVSLNSEQDYKNAEPKIVECAVYLFSTPVSEDNVNRLTATQFVLKWMTGTDYTFNIDQKITDLTDGNSDLFGMYLAGMSKLVLENSTSKFTDDELHAKVTDMLIAYCKDSKNNCKPTKQLKKLMKD